MTNDLSAYAFGLATEFGLPAIDGNNVAVLSVDALDADEAVTIRPVAAAPITDWALAMDVYIPTPASSYVALFQTGGGDADLFLKAQGGSAAIGTQGVYSGAVPFDQWVRLAVTVTTEDGVTILRKFVNGELAGTQNLGATSRWTIDPAQGLKLFADDDGETSGVHVASLFFMPNPPEAPVVAALMASTPTASADGFFAVAPSDSAIEIGFAGGALDLRYGEAAVILEGADYRTPVSFGDSQIARASQFGITLPGADVPVLHHSAFAANEGLKIDLPEGAANLTSFTMVWDLQTGTGGGYQSLLQLDATNASDGELFIRGDGALGISGSYTGAVPAEVWTRIAVTVADQGNGTSVLSKFIDGVLVGTQSVSTVRFTVDAEKGFLILSDEDGETAPGYLAHFGLADRALSAAEVAALGTVDGDGPFAAGEGLAQLGFDGHAPTVEQGFAAVTLTDTTPLPPEPEPVVNGLKDMLVTVGSASASFDLTEVFGAGAHDFAVTTTNGTAVAASITDGVLTLDYGALGLSDLVLTAVSASGAALDDHLRVRVAGEGAYTIAIIPDTQDYTSDASIMHTYADMMTWLAGNADSKAISFVSQIGDVTQWAAASQFATAKAAFDILREAGIPFSVLPGNHDIGTGGSSDVRVTDTFNAAFSVSYMSEDPTFAGTYDQEPGRYDNNYHLWTAPDGTDWIVLNLEFGPRTDVLRWADEVLTEHSDRKAMVLTHSYNNYNGRHDPLGGPLEGEGAGYDYGLGKDPAGSWDGEEIWREVISSHANVVFTAGGHIFGDGAQTVVSYNDYGNPVFQFLLNYQNGVATETTGAGDPALGSGGGNGAIRLITVDPANDAFYTETYFTDLDTYFTGARETEEQSRDGLTGSYVGHQEEYHDVDLGARPALAEAHAGADQLVSATAGADHATVTLSAAGTTNPLGDIAAMVWTDEDGHEIARGATAGASLGAGVHDLALTVTTKGGVTSTDEVRVIVKTDQVWLAETFNDGDAAGWSSTVASSALPAMTFGTDASFGLPRIGSDPAEVLLVKAQPQQSGILVKPGLSGDIASYTLVYDLYVPAGQGTWTSLLQTGIGNTSDGEIFLRRSGETAGIGISGTYQGSLSYDAWNRIALTVSVEDGAQVLRKYVNGELIGTQTLAGDATGGTRWTLDADTGFLLFADEDGETSDVYVASVAFTPKVLSGAEIAALGGVDADGPLASGPEGAFQLNFEGSLGALDFGSAGVTRLDLREGSELGNFQVKGGGGEAALFDSTNTAGNLLLWKDGHWQNLTFEVTLRSMDDDTIGVTFNQGADGSHYLLTFDNQTNARVLARVEGGVTTVLATESGGLTFNTAQDLVVTNVGGRITATLDGQVLFGGAVVDARPLGAGTVGLYSSGQHSSIFDDVVVRAPETTAQAGQDLLVIDWNGDGHETVTLDGEGSVLTGATTVAWTGRDLAASTLETPVEAQAGRSLYTLTLNGKASDQVVVNVASGDQLIAADRFEDGNATGWRIVDTTEIGGGAHWQVIDGHLTETSGASSRELTFDSASTADVWHRGWSPLGDGTYALHKGSFALWEGDTTLTDYAIRAEVTASSGAVGLMLNYVDENNYYKLEIDSRVGLVTLVKVVDNYESNIARAAATFTAGHSFTLEASVVGGRIEASVDGLDLFAYPVEVHDIKTGAAGVWAWGSAGAAFDDIAIVDLTRAFRSTFTGTAGNDAITGTAEGDVIASGAGRLDRMTGGLGADTFVFGSEAANGVRETDRITDYQVGVDRIDLGGALVSKVVESASSVLLWIGADQDQLQIAGVSQFDDILFA